MTIKLEGQTDELIAQFILASEEAGVPLPANTKGSLLDVLGRQWRGFVKSRTADLDREFSEVALLLTERRGALAISVETSQVARTYRARRLVERLERVRPGLGWYVYDMLNGLYSRGIHFMDMSVYSYFIDRYGSAPGSDEELAQAILEEQFYEETDLLPFDASRMEEYKEALADFAPAWPSEVRKTLGGHAHLAGLPSRDGDSRKPKALSKTAFKRLASDKTLPRKVRSALLAARDLEKRFDSIEKHLLTPEDEERVPLFLLAWDSPHTLWSTANTLLDESMESGVLTYNQATLGIEIGASQSDLQTVAMTLINYIEMYRALLKLLEHFDPV